MADILKVLGLDCVNNCIKYVLNSCRCHSNCCDLCDLEIETEAIDVPEENSHTIRYNSEDGLSIEY